MVKIVKVIESFDNDKSETSKAHDRTYVLGYIHALEDVGNIDKAYELRELCKKHNVGGVLGV